VSAQDTIRLQEEVDWPPFTPALPGKATSGLAYDLMSAIFAKLVVKVELEVYPFARALENAKAGRIDGVTTVNPTPDRATYLAFSIPTVPKKGFIYFKADRKSELAWETYQDLSGLRLGVVGGNAYSPEFDSAVRGGSIKVLEVSTLDLLPKMVVTGRIDGFLAVGIVADRLIEKQGFVGQLARSRRPYVVSDYTIGIAKSSRFFARLPQIDQAIRTIQKDGTLKKILAKYGL